MKVIVFGASGGTGRQLVEQALVRGYDVSAFMRNPAAITMTHPQLRVVQGDAFDAAAVVAAVQGQQAVLCALGAKTRSKDPVASEGARNIIAAMKKAGVHRLVCVTAASVDDGWQRLSLPVRFLLKPLLGPLRADKGKQERFIRESGLAWVIVRPPMLTNEPPTGRWRVGDDFPIGLRAKVTRADVAAFMLDQISSDAYLYQTPAIINV